MIELITLDQINFDLNKNFGNNYELFKTLSKFESNYQSVPAFVNYKFKTESEFKDFVSTYMNFKLGIYEFLAYDPNTIKSNVNNVNIIMIDISYQEFLRLLKLKEFL